jgi:hypothetical protein
LPCWIAPSAGPRFRSRTRVNPLTITAIRQIIISPSGEETVIPPIFGDSLDREDAEVVE